LRWSLPGLLLTFAIGAGAAALMVSLEARRLREYSLQVVPARATLVSVEVRRWLPGRENWSAFGTFDIVAGDHRGRAEGSLIPSSFFRTKPRRYQVPRAEAETFVPKWRIGATYDGYWNPEHPSGVFFSPVPYEEQLALARSLQVACVVLLVAAWIAGRFSPRSRGQR
jgi:hypothetical protein